MPSRSYAHQHKSKIDTSIDTALLFCLSTLTNYHYQFLILFNFHIDHGSTYATFRRCWGLTDLSCVYDSLSFNFIFDSTRDRKREKVPRFFLFCLDNFFFCLTYYFFFSLHIKVKIFFHFFLYFSILYYKKTFWSEIKIINETYELLLTYLE